MSRATTSDCLRMTRLFVWKRWHQSFVRIIEVLRPRKYPNCLMKRGGEEKKNKKKQKKTEANAKQREFSTLTINSSQIFRSILKNNTKRKRRGDKREEGGRRGRKGERKTVGNNKKEPQIDPAEGNPCSPFSLTKNR